MIKAWGNILKEHWEEIAFLLLFSLCCYSTAFASPRDPVTNSAAAFEESGASAIPFTISVGTNTVVAVSTNSASFLNITTHVAVELPQLPIYARRKILLQLNSYSNTGQAWDVCVGTHTRMTCSGTDSGVVLSTRAPVNKSEYVTNGTEPVYVLGAAGAASTGTAVLRGNVWYDPKDLKKSE